MNYELLSKLSMEEAEKYKNDALILRTRNEIIYQETLGSNLQSSILNPLNQQYSATQNMKLFRSILETVSVGAVGYLAYQHLKKYGFLKKH